MRKRTGEEKLENQSLAGDFTTGSIPKKLIKFMLPILGALILQAMYGAVDLLIVGQFGTDAGISGVATGSNVINLVTFICVAMTMGVTVIIGQHLGEERPEKISETIGGAIWFFAISAVAIAILLLIFAPQCAMLLNAPEEAFDLTVQYVRICGVGMIFVVAYNFISAVFRGLGNSKFPLLFVFIACCANIVGDLLFVAVFDMNVAGAALATIMAQAISVLLSLIIIKKQKLPFHFRPKDIRYNAEVPAFLKVGAPIAFQELITNGSFLVILAIVNQLGLDASSGYGIAQKIVSFVLLIPSALMQSMSAFVAQNVGAGLENRSRKAMLMGMLFGVLIGVPVFLFNYFAGDLPAQLFTGNAAFVAQAADYLRGFSPEAILTAFVFSFIGYFSGHGKTIPVMLQGVTASLCFRIPLTYLFSLAETPSLVTIGTAAPLASVYGILFFGLWFLVFTRKMKKQAEVL